MAWISPAITDTGLRPLVFLVLGSPLLVLAFDVVGELMAPGSRLGADPGKAVVHFLGDWSIWMLLLTLAVASARRLTGRSWLLRYRRMIGLYAFAYVCLHLLAYLGFLAGFDTLQIVEDVADSPYITVGFLGFALLVPLAVTSTNRWRRRLGRRWIRLHRAIYPAAAAAIVHHFWLTKDGYGESVLYLAVFLLLMLERFLNVRRSGRRSPLPDR